MKKLTPLLIAILFFGELTAQVYVDENATGNNNGTSWNNAFTDLQSAIAIAVSGTEIWIAEGIYKPTSTTDRTISFVLPSDISIYGGFSPANGSIDMATRDSDTYETILSGEIGTVGNDNDNTYIVVSTTDVTNLTADGLIIQDASARGTEEASAGWLYSNVSMVSQINISRCIFRNNQGTLGGAFINLSVNSDANVYFEHCIFSGNVSYFTTLGTGFGGAIINFQLLSNSLMTLDNCLLYDNAAVGYGGAIYNNNQNNSSLELNVINSSICKNFASAGEGNAIYNEGEGISMNIVNSILWNSKVNVTPKEITSQDAIGLNISNSFVVGVDNTPSNGLDGIFPSSITFALVENITFNDYANNDFTQTDFAWTRDAGDNTEVNVLEDLIRNNRILDGNNDGTATVDIGVYEYKRDCLPFAAQTNPITVQLDASGNYNLTQDDKDAIVNGSAGDFLSFSFSQESFTCTDIPSVDIVVTISEVCTGLSEDKIATITVEDNEVPIINCIADDTRDIDTGVCTYAVVGTEFDASFTDNCTSGIISNDLNGTTTIANEVLPLGITTVIWTVDNGNGQTATCTTIITVEDNEAPIISCIADDTRDTDTGVCTYAVVGTEFDATFTDNCTSGIISNDLNGTTTIADEVLPLGVTTVVWTVDDGNGQTATCTTIITVEDNVVPVIACPVDIAVNTDIGQCSTVVIFPDAIAFDNCGIDTVAQTAGLPSGSPFPVGVNTVEYTATDSSGNTAVCSFTITVTDNEPAMAVCQDITIQLDANGDATIVAADVDGGSTDNCNVASIAIDIETFTCADVGPNDVTLTVTDVNGNVSNCIAVVTVEDVTMPAIVCMDITVQLDASGTITILSNDVDNGSSDACGIVSYDLDINTFDCSNVGPNNVVLTVTDTSGNTATCTVVVTVEDVTMPELECMDITLELDANGTAIITTADILASIDDACGINTTSVDIQNFDCSDIGTPVTVTIFAMDNNGNLASCTAVVTVIDALAPVVTCPADQIVDPGQGNLFYEVPDYFATGEATALDNCTDPLMIVSQDPAVGTLLSDGTYTITISAMDEYGNIGTCTFELTVESVLGVDDIELNLGSIVIYPNPAQEFVILSNPQFIALQQATIYDLTGRVIRNISLENMGGEKQINLSNLSSAMYLMVIESENERIIKRIVKE